MKHGVALACVASVNRSPESPVVVCRSLSFPDSKSHMSFLCWSLLQFPTAPLLCVLHKNQTGQSRARWRVPALLFVFVVPCTFHGKLHRGGLSVIITVSGKDVINMAVSWWVLFVSVILALFRPLLMLWCCRSSDWGHTEEVSYRFSLPSIMKIKTLTSNILKKQVLFIRSFHCDRIRRNVNQDPRLSLGSWVAHCSLFRRRWNLKLVKHLRKGAWNH